MDLADTVIVDTLSLMIIRECIVSQFGFALLTHLFNVVIATLILFQVVLSIVNNHHIVVLCFILNFNHFLVVMLCNIKPTFINLICSILPDVVESLSIFFFREFLFNS